MTGLFEEKYDELLTEFNYYVTEHPEFAERIPPDALVVLLDKGDPVFSRGICTASSSTSSTTMFPAATLSMSRSGGSPPVRSRLRNLRLMKDEPRCAA